MRQDKKVVLEMQNGVPFQFQAYVKGLINSQDLDAWKSDPEKFDEWMQKTVKHAISQCKFVIK